MLFFVACISCITVACDSDDDGTKGDDNKFPAPEVTFSAITGVSFTAGWNALETADSYRYEVSYEKDGQVVAVAAQNTETTTFSLDGLLPATDYSVRVVAKAGGKTISDWFSGTVRTLGGESVTFTVTPYERYIENAFIYPYAEVKPSDSEVYYWVSAIPSNSERDPKEWMQEDIDYYMELGKTWDDLVADKLILKGDAESVPFAFTGYDHYYFIVAPVGKNLSEIVVSGEVSRSYRFWYEAREVQMLHESTYEQFAGEWLLQTSGTVKEENGSLDVQEVGEEFPVTISPADDKKSFYLKGWGGDRNKFRDFAIKMDFEPAEDNYHKIGISFPQDIETEGDIVWKYVSWYNFVGTVGDEKVYTYLPYDDNDADFCLRIHGDSMINARINDGDIVFIKQQSTVENGEIAAVLVNDSATLKRVYFVDDTVQLRSENPKYKPMIFSKNNCDNFRILGKAIALYTKF